VVCGGRGGMVVVELVRQINKGNMQVRWRTVQVNDQNPQVEDIFWQVRDFSLIKVINKWDLHPKSTLYFKCNIHL
jgi:hypothetical protein